MSTSHQGFNRYKRYNSRYKAHGVQNLTQEKIFDLLLTLWDTGLEAREGAPLMLQMGEVASRLDLSRNTVVINMDHLENVGLIKREGLGRRGTAVWVYPPESIPPSNLDRGLPLF